MGVFMVAKVITKASSGELPYVFLWDPRMNLNIFQREELPEEDQVKRHSGRPCEDNYQLSVTWKKEHAKNHDN